MNPMIEAVFRNVIQNFVWESDESTWGKREYWASVGDCAKQNSPDGKIHGDCDDFTVLCRAKLASVGIDSRAVYCIAPDAGAHLVCEVDGWILDCRQTSVISRDLLPYQWISRSGILPGEPWHSIAEV